MSNTEEEFKKEEPAQASSEPTIEDTSLEDKLKEFEQKYIYLYAEFENYKKRAIKERTDALKFGWEPAAREFLGVLDNLERSLSFLPVDDKNPLTQGLKMVLQQFSSSFERFGVSEIKSDGETFDPNLHEAVGQEKSDDLEEGKIIRTEMKGYMLHGRLLRPSRVVVSKGKD